MGRPFFPYPEARVEVPGPEESRVLEIGRGRCLPMLRLWGILQNENPGGPGPPDLLGLLASCYAQGVRDAARTVVDRGWCPPGEA